LKAFGKIDKNAANTALPNPNAHGVGLASQHSRLGVYAEMLLLLLAAFIDFAAPYPVGGSAAALDVDVIVFGATPSGVAAGIAAANGVGARHAVHIFEQLDMLGGMVSSARAVKPRPQTHAPFNFEP